MDNRRRSFGNGARKTSLNSARGFSIGLDVLSTTKVFAGILILMGIIATSATLLIGQEASSGEASDIEYFSESDSSYQAEEATTSSTIATTSTTSTTETSSTTSTSTTMKRVRVEKTTTTTTLACGGDWQPPCKEGCNEDAILGADDLCHIPDCVKSVSSGKSGCGAFALKFCSSGTYKRTNLDREVINSE